MRALSAFRTLMFTAMLGIVCILGARNVRADDLIPAYPTLLGTTSATIGLTPIQDSTSGFGRFFLDYSLGGNYNAVVYWVDSFSEQPFTADAGQFTFIPGVYTHPTEQLSISAQHTCCGDDFSFLAGGSRFDFTLPSTVVPNLNSAYTSYGGDKYYLFGVQATVYNVPRLLEPSSWNILIGIGLMALLLCLTRLHTAERSSRDH